MSIAEDATTTLDVPEEHHVLFREAALIELSSNGEWVEQQGRECIAAEGSPEHAKYLLDSVGGPISYLDESAEVVRLLFAGETRIPEARITNLAHIAETMARKVVKPRIAGSLVESPLADDDVSEVESLTSALTWAVRTAADLHELYAAECAKREEVAA